MHAFIYKSLHKADTYLYLSEKDGFARVPEPVLAPLGRLQLVLETEIHAGRKLAREDSAVVRANLERLGFHLQRPAQVLDPLVSGGVGDG